MTEVLVKHPRFSIYGEIHNAIDNRVYEDIYSTFEKDEIVLCEHSTFKPFLALEEKAIQHCGFDHLLDKMKGSDWIYINQKSLSLPVTCVDIRVEYGFPTAAEEVEFSQHGLEDPEACVEFIYRVISTAIAHKEKCENYPTLLPVMVKEVCDRYDEIKEMLNEEESIDEIYEHFDCLVTLLRRVAGLFVDVHILEILESHLMTNSVDSPHISIFVGARHATSMYHILSTIYDNVEIFYKDE